MERALFCPASVVPRNHHPPLAPLRASTAASGSRRPMVAHHVLPGFRNLLYLGEDRFQRIQQQIPIPLPVERRSVPWHTSRGREADRRRKRSTRRSMYGIRFAGAGRVSGGASSRSRLACRLVPVSFRLLSEDCGDGSSITWPCVHPHSKVLTIKCGQAHVPESQQPPSCLGRRYIRIAG